MGLTGKQKAAMLLMSLDASTATELLKDVDAKVVEELAVESAYLDAAGLNNKEQSLELAQQFCNSLKPREEFCVKSTLCETLKSMVGRDKVRQIQNSPQKRNPFTRISSLDSQTIASVLAKEHPRSTAVVLSELPAKKSSDVLDLLGDGIRFSAVNRMTTCEHMTAQAKARIAETVCRHLEATTVGAAGLEEPLRKVAVILRNLGKDLWNGLLGAIQKKQPSQ